MIKAVDTHQDLLRISIASAGNDCRLGGHEAPPAIVSIFLGDELTGILTALEAENPYDRQEKREMNIGVNFMPRFPRDTTDRNRTSPFAFTGNKFEFRMPGSSFSVAGPNVVINTIVADVLMEFANELENARNFTGALNTLIRDTIREHKRIIFNGNNYSGEWEIEAAKRGLINWPSSAEALCHYADPKNIALFERHKVFTGTEIRSRQEILLENYVKIVKIEALTMTDMVNRDILPAILNYSAKLAGDAHIKAQIGVDDALDKALCGTLSRMAANVRDRAKGLSDALSGANESAPVCDQARYFREAVVSAIANLRSAVDEAEPMVPAKLWPYPNYGNLLFSVS